MWPASGTPGGAALPRTATGKLGNHSDPFLEVVARFL
jgi:hypothetical protein